MFVEFKVHFMLEKIPLFLKKKNHFVLDYISYKEFTLLFATTHRLTAQINFKRLTDSLLA